MESKWTDLSWEEKRDRVPCRLPTVEFPVHYAGITLRTAMYDYAEMKRAWLKFLYEFDGDTFAGPRVSVSPGRMGEILDSRFSRWPGHGLPENASMDQFVEGEYMKADEYDALLKDPSDYCLRFYLPRTMGALEPLQKLIPLRSTLGLPTMFLAACTAPDVQAAFQAIIDAGKELANFQEVVREINTEARAAGFPSLTGGFAHAPFDLLGDTLRGTHGIVMDMYRQPDKLLEAMEIVTPWIIETGIAGANASGGPIILMPLHKGDDTFMSDKQFETFYWPYLRKVIVGLVNEGCMPLLFAEGSYNRRLETVKDVPKGSVLWWFDKTDMTRAKEILGDTACISGNVPTSLMRNGTPQAVKQYCINLIEDCGKGGGFILTGGASIDKGNPDNLHAMIEAAKEFGVYK
ncbi:MAG: uroporphyrinogen decarboxylase family protein [Dehalococcoidia bacterium]